MKFKPLVKEKVKEEILKLIEENRGYDYVKIPSERDLSETFQVSRTTIRSVIKELINYGLLIQFQGKGTYIVPKTRDKIVHILSSPDIKSDDPFYARFFVELTNIFTLNGFKILFVNVESLTNESKKNKDIPIVMIGLLNDELIEKVKRSYKYILTIEQYMNHDEIIQVSVDDYRIGWMAAEILIKSGYLFLIHLAGPERYTASYLRKIGFLDRVKSSTRINYRVIESKMNYTSGYMIGDEIYSIYNKIREPIGIFTANDWMGIGLIQRLKEKRLNIGKEIGIIGCDNISLSTEIKPSLTTFKWDVEKIVKEILNIIIDINHGKNITQKRVLIPAQVIYRDSLRL
uniref:LacI family transcriptional regulator n=1 Tax=Dictyoglomus thermophilum TaxID=14 RepID=A0A7C3MKQ9_DICTH